MKDRRKKVMAPGIVADIDRRRPCSDWLQKGFPGDRRKMIRRKMDGGQRFTADPLGDDEGEMG